MAVPDCKVVIDQCQYVVKGVRGAFQFHFDIPILIWAGTSPNRLDQVMLHGLVDNLVVDHHEVEAGGWEPH